MKLNYQDVAILHYSSPLGVQGGFLLISLHKAWQSWEECAWSAALWRAKRGTARWAGPCWDSVRWHGETGRDEWREFLRMPAPMQREMLFPPKPLISLASKEPGYLYALTRIKEMSRRSRLPRRPAGLRSYWICLLAKCQLNDRLQALPPGAIILVITSDKPL